MAPKRKRPATGTAAEDANAAGTAPDASADSNNTATSPKPSKRTRATSRASTSTTPKIVTNKLDDGMDVDDESVEEDSDENKGGTGKGENGEAGKMRMDAPPGAGMVDPVGYKTNPPPEGRAIRVYADGVFDLFHLGHMRQLQQAKTAFSNVYLLVGVTGDRETHRRKGLTVLSAAERAESVRHCKWVDEVVEDCPWVVTPDFLTKHNIDYVAHDDIPYGAAEGDDIYAAIKKRGQFLVTQRTEGVSTTGIITKIVRDYESYIARQLQRGQSRKELNISWLKKNELDIKRHVKEVGESIKTNWSTTGQELGRDFRQFWMPGMSRPASPAPGTAAAGDGGSVRGRRTRASEVSLTSPTTPAGDRSAAQSPGAWSRFSMPGSVGGRDRDFVAGYAMGLLGSVRGWMQRNRRNVRDPGDAELGDLPLVEDGATGPTSSASDDDEHLEKPNGSDAPKSIVEKLEASVAEH